ncbi:MAG: hypothetical protein ACRCUS_00415 [Anaerovoracaceae bacterium]
MNGFRNWMYNSSDIIVAVIILLVAIGVIYWKMSTLVAYSVDMDPSAFGLGKIVEFFKSKIGI